MNYALYLDLARVTEYVIKPSTQFIFLVVISIVFRGSFHRGGKPMHVLFTHIRIIIIKGFTG